MRSCSSRRLLDAYPQAAMACSLDEWPTRSPAGSGTPEVLRAFPPDEALSDRRVRRPRFRRAAALAGRSSATASSSSAIWITVCAAAARRRTRGSSRGSRQTNGLHVRSSAARMCVSSQPKRRSNRSKRRRARRAIHFSPQSRGGVAAARSFSVIMRTIWWRPF